MIERLRTWISGLGAPKPIQPFYSVPKPAGPKVGQDILAKCDKCGRITSIWRVFADGKVSCVPCAGQVH